jgi:hypothetical protein
MSEVATLSRSLDEAVSGEQIADGGAGRPVAVGVGFAEEFEKFLSAQVG